MRGKNGSVLPRIRPMRLRLVKEPFDHPDYLFELKHDGFRVVVYVRNGECQIISRNQRRLKFDSLAKAIAGIRVRDAIIDGELVCLDDFGVSQFNRLLFRRRETVLYAFDLLWHDGEDLRLLPLIGRKARLAQLVQTARCERLLYAQHIEGCGKRFFAEICARDLEGIVGKRKLGVYKDDSDGWVKVKNRSYSQAEGRHELESRMPVADHPNHELSIAEVSGTQKSADPLWNNSAITYWGVTDIRDGIGTQSGYYNNVHGDKGRDWGTFEGRVTVEGTKVTVEGTYKNIGGDGEFRGVTGNGKFKTVLKSATEIDCTWTGEYKLAKAKAHAR